MELEANKHNVYKERAVKMLTLIVNSEEEYLDLVADLSMFGLHYPNPYAKADDNNMSISDSFNKLDPKIIEEYLGICDYEPELTTEIDEDGKEWEVEKGCGDELNRSTLHVCSELSEYVSVPKKEDYPILIMWMWDDDYDRWGKITTRYFDWISISSVPQSHNNEKTIIKQKFDMWNDKYGKELQKLKNSLK